MGISKSKSKTLTSDSMTTKQSVKKGSPFLKTLSAHFCAGYYTGVTPFVFRAVNPQRGTLSLWYGRLRQSRTHGSVAEYGIIFSAHFCAGTLLGRYGFRFSRGESAKGGAFAWVRTVAAIGLK